MKKLISFIAAVGMMTAVLSASAAAVEYGGIGGKPANPQPSNPRTSSIFIFELKPGQQANDGVKVYNNTNTAHTITIDAVDSVLASGGSFSCAQSAEQKSDVGSWITLDQTSVNLVAGGSTVVPFTVSVPQTAGVGEHDGCITIQDTSIKQATGKSGVILGFRSAMRVVVTVPGQIVKKLALSSLTVSRLSSGDYQVVPKVENQGNVSLDTKVAANFKSIIATNSGTSKGTYPVLPHSTASWNLTLKRPFWGGWYRAYATVNYNSNPTALLGQNIGSQETKSLYSAFFFAPPKTLAAVIEIVVLILIVIVLRWYVQKRRDIRHIRANWQEYKVKKNDTIVDIAKAHHTSWKKLARVNGIRPPYRLVPGQKLKVPPQQQES